MITRVTSFLQFEMHVATKGRKTEVWSVYARLDKHGDHVDNFDNFLGTVEWRTGWRRYVLYPDVATQWDAQCLADVAAFLTERMLARKAVQP